MIKYLRLSLIFLFFSISICTYTQTETHKFICLKNNKTLRIKYFKEGKRIKYKLKNGSVIFKGRIIAIEDSSIIISDSRYKLSDFSMISGRPVGLSVAKVAGGTIATGGVAIMAIGVNILTNISRSDDDYARLNNFFIIIIGSGMVLSGGVVTLVGVVPFLINVKKFNLEGEWQISVCK
jgi:hypothetical protein